MPVVLLPDNYDEWLDPNAEPAPLRRLLRPIEPSILEAYPVSRAVNKPENDWVECVEPISVEEE